MTKQTFLTVHSAVNITSLKRLKWPFPMMFFSAEE